MGGILHGVFPILVSVVFTLIGYCIGFSHNVSNFDKVLDGTIVFSSIVVGFLSALLGILVSIRDTDIVKAIFEKNTKLTLKYYFYEAILLGFIVVLFSGAMHVLRGSNEILADIIFYIWSFLIFWFVPSAFRIVNILMSIFFRTNVSQTRPESNTGSEDEKEKIKQRLKKES